MRKKRRSSSKKRRLLINLVLLAALIGLFLWTNAETKRQQSQVAPPVQREQAKGEKTEQHEEAQVEATEAEEEQAKGERPWKLAEENLQGIQSSSYIVYDVAADEVIYEKDSDTKTYPASLTKLMTVLVAIEHLTDSQLQEKVIISPEIFWALAEQDSSMSGFSPNEEVKVKDLLYGTMIASGGDTTEILARMVAGDAPSFIEMMNAKAKELGMTNTHFANTTGLHDAEHTMSVKDTLTLLRTGMENKTFRDLITTATYKSEGTNLHPQGVTIRSSLMRLLKDQPENFRFLGGKTGYTDEAGLTLASLTRVEGREFYIVTMNAPVSEDRAEAVRDHIRIMNGLIAANE